jgi:hypothetical protein
MHKHLFTDRSGVVWAFRDYRVTEDGPQPVRLGDASAEYRAFIAEETGQLVAYTFGDVSSRATAPNVLEGQLLWAKTPGHDASMIRAMRPSGEFEAIRDERVSSVRSTSSGGSMTITLDNSETRTTS